MFLPSPTRTGRPKALLPGTRIASKGGGTHYVVTEVVSTLRRERPKVKGKAARRADKRRRRRLREGVTI